MPQTKLLYIHIPKTAGSFLGEYIARHLPYRRILSDKQTDAGVWTDYTLVELNAFRQADQVLLHTHTLSYGWHDLAYVIPWAEKDDIINTIRAFKADGWFTFAFVRHPGEILCSFYHYVYNFHEAGEPHIVAAHAPVVERSIDTFVAEHCERELLPDYWRELDVVAEASDATFTEFFKTYLDHDFQPGAAPAHASGNPGYAYYCEQGLISAETQRKVIESQNMAIYRAIITQA
jgi:hypothetical protein